MRLRRHCRAFNFHISMLFVCKMLISRPLGKIPLVIIYNQSLLSEVLDIDMMANVIASQSCWIRYFREDYRQMEPLGLACAYFDSSTWLILLQTAAACSSAHFGGRGARRRLGVHFLPPSPWVFPSACVSVCARVFSIGCSWVAKQPRVCMMEWGWEEREAPGQERQTFTSIATSD